MPVQRDISKAVTKRVLKFAETVVREGKISSFKEFAEIAGMDYSQFRSIKRDSTRYFTVDHLYKIGKHFNLNMNYLIYGKGTLFLEDAEQTSISEQLKVIITKLDKAFDGKVKG